jgi:hypothetical protein
MKKLLLFSPALPSGAVADDLDAPCGDADRPAVLVVGQNDAERIDEHVRMLRRFSELALVAAERMHEREEARATAPEPEAAVAPEPAPRSATEPDDGKISVSLSRFSRVARLNILLEQKLVEDLRNPEPRRRAAPPRQARQAQKQAEQEALLAERRAAVEEMVENCAATDETLDRERYDELMDELRAVLGAGRLDEHLLDKDPRTVAWLYMCDKKVNPDWPRIAVEANVALDEGRPEPTYPPPPSAAERASGAVKAAAAAEPAEAAPEGGDPRTDQKARPP